MTQIVDYDELFPGRFIKAGDLKGRDVTVEIADVEKEELPQEKGGDRERGILSFKGTKKKLVLNRTNGECVKAMFGRKVPGWIGKRLTLYPAEWNGDLCIRIRGSPDISAPVTFELKLPRKKPKATTLVVTGKGGKAAPAKSQEEELPEAGPEEIEDTIGAAARAGEPEQPGDIQF